MNPPDLTWVEPLEQLIPPELVSLSEHPVVMQALIRRGITNLNQAQAFINPGLYPLASPLDLPDMDAAVARLQQAVENREKIAIWGDFDVDGQTATALLAQTLNLLGAKYMWHIPIRAHESHGVNLTGLERLIQSGAQLLLTCDTGITAHAEVDFARRHHLDVVITDHHTLPPTLPDAAAVVNPQRLPDHHPLHPLCGVGTAYQLARELLQQNRMGEKEQLLRDLVALGTIADVAALTGDNRCLVQTGLQAFRDSPRPAIAAMLSLSAVNPASLNEEHLSFIIAPRLNAIGRLGDANPIVSFLLTEDKAQISSITQELEALNASRKLLCDQVFKAALEKLQQEKTLQDDDILVLEHPNWPAGVIGIAASRLVERFHKPVILISAEPGGTGRASARSIEGINITQALADNQNLLTGFGGHAMAAGFSLSSEKIPRFRRAMNQTICQMTTDNPPVFNLPIDAFVDLKDITFDLVESIEHLAPFGAGNPPIVMASRGLVIKSQAVIGKTKEHLQAIVEDSSSESRKILWWQGAGSPLPEGSFDLAYSARAVNFRGQRAIQLEWLASRQIDSTAAIQIQTRIEVVDRRRCSDPVSLLTALAGQSDTALWMEGEKSPPVQGADRYHLKPAQNLIVWNIPPGRDEWMTILRAVKPRQVILFGIRTGAENPQAFLNQLAGLVRYCLKENKGKTSYQSLAVATAQREAAVKAGLLWLACKGFITFEEDEEGSLTFQSPGKVDSIQIKRVESELNSLMAETSAYRAYYLRADPAHLMED